MTQDELSDYELAAGGEERTIPTDNVTRQDHAVRKNVIVSLIRDLERMRSENDLMLMANRRFTIRKGRER